MSHDWHWIAATALVAVAVVGIASAPVPWDRVLYARRQKRARLEPAVSGTARSRVPLTWDTDEAGYLVPLRVHADKDDDDDEGAAEVTRAMAVLDTGSRHLALKTEGCVLTTDEVDREEDAQQCPRTGTGAALPARPSDRSKPVRRSAYGTQTNTFVESREHVVLDAEAGSDAWTLGESAPVQRIVRIEGESSSNLLGTSGQILVAAVGADGWTMRLDPEHPRLELGTDISHQFQRCARLPSADDRSFIRCRVRSMWSGPHRIKAAPTVAIVDTGTTCTYMPESTFDEVDLSKPLVIELGSDPRNVVTLHYEPDELVDFEYPAELAIRRDEGELADLFGKRHAAKTLMLGVLLLRNHIIHVRDRHIFVRRNHSSS